MRRIIAVNVTPTVELNALAMKLSQPTSYNFVEASASSNASTNTNRAHVPPPNLNFRGMYNQRYICDSS